MALLVRRAGVGPDLGISWLAAIQVANLHPQSYWVMSSTARDSLCVPTMAQWHQVSVEATCIVAHGERRTWLPVVADQQQLKVSEAWWEKRESKELVGVLQKFLLMVEGFVVGRQRALGGGAVSDNRCSKRSANT